MALSRRSGRRFEANIWPGFVDAMTALLLVLMFVLSIFMVVQSILSQTISDQDSELVALTSRLSELADSLGLERQKNEDLENQIGTLTTRLSQARQANENLAGEVAALGSLVAEREATLQAQAADLAELAARLADTETANADLTANLDAARGERDALVAEEARLSALVAELQDDLDVKTQSLADLAAALDDREDQIASLGTDLEAARTELSEAEKARLAELAAAELLRRQVAEVETALTEAEKAKLAEAAAAEVLRQRLENAQAEITAMSLQLEDQRKKAEETLTLLAAAELAQKDLTAKLALALADLETAQAGQAEKTVTTEELRQKLAEAQAELAALKATNTDITVSQQELQDRLTAALAEKLAADDQIDTLLTEAEQRQILLANANKQLENVQVQAAEDARNLAVLNEQMLALRAELAVLQGLLDDAQERDAEADVQIQNLGGQLNAALAQLAAEQKARAELEEAERKRLEREAELLKEDAERLKLYRSEFFGRLREVLGDQDGVRIEGDRFVFSSEVLFPSGEAELSDSGRREVAKVARIIRSVLGEIPTEIPWIIRVDGHTDNVPINPGGEYVDNWELSQARALSVVRYMIDFLDIPPARLAAAGFGEYQPVALGDGREARALNRRIELKLTEK